MTSHHAIQVIMEIKSGNYTKLGQFFFGPLIRTDMGSLAASVNRIHILPLFVN